MRVTTPAEAGQVPPNGIPLIYGGGGSVGSYNQTFDVSGDFATVSDSFFTPPVDGLYRVALFAIVISPTGAGTLNVGANQPAGIGLFISQALNLNGSNLTFQTSDGILLVSGGPIVVDRSVAGFGAPNGSYRVSLRAYLLA